jgi:sialidase-1
MKRLTVLLLLLIASTAVAQVPASKLQFGRGGLNNAPVFFRGDSPSVSTGANFVRVPVATRCDNGTIVAAMQINSSSADLDMAGIMISTSVDNGLNWSSPVRIVTESTPSTHHIGNPCLVFNKYTRTLWLLYRRNKDASPTAADAQAFITSSTDYGATWTTPVEITSSVKVTGAGAPSGHTWPSTAWFDIIPGPSKGIVKENGTNKGRIIFACYHRLVSGGVSYVHIIYSDDNGVTWVLGGGPDQTNTTNDDNNEPSILERNNGTLVINCRRKAGSLRGQTTSSDGGATWTTTTTPAALSQWTNNGTQGGFAKLGNWWILFNPSSTAGRLTGKIWWSTDEGVTWSATQSKVVHWGYCAYSTLVPLSDTDCLMLFEQGYSAGTTGWARHIAQVTFNRAWLTHPAPQYTLLNFNERASGWSAVAGDSNGTDEAEASIHDFGSNSLNAQPQPYTAPPTYIAGSSTIGMRLTTGTDFVMLAPADNNFYKPDGTTSFTIEMLARIPSATSGTIFATKQVAPYHRLDLDGTGKLRYRITNNGTNINTITSTAAINDNAWHRIVIRVTRGGNIEMLIDGSAAATAVADSGYSTVDSSSISMTTLGELPDGTDQCAVDFDWFRFTRGARSNSDLLSAGYAANKNVIYTVPTYSNTPASISGLQLWVPAPTQGLCFADQWASLPIPPQRHAYYPIHSLFERTGWFLNTNGMNRHPRITYDPYVGPMFNISTPAELRVLNANGTDSPSKNFDFIHNTGTFSISFWAYFSSAGSSLQAILDSNSRSNANNGFHVIWVNSSNQIQFYATSGGVDKAAPLSSNGSVQGNTLYHIVIQCSGAGSPVLMYITPATSTSIAAVQTLANFGTATSNASATGRHVVIGNQMNDANGMTGRWADICIYNVAIDGTARQTLFDYGKNWVTRQ